MYLSLHCHQRLVELLNLKIYSHMASTFKSVDSLSSTEQSSQKHTKRKSKNKKMKVIILQYWTLSLLCQM